ncbi:hypothetical protein SAMN05216238_11213 [Lentibacillus persicus]|uniref:Uncharacterized protein n=1 Tax=Lentibacillus persicus TaxID=640948 RepID=A0A1I1Z9T6_9BACI|nr:hypothetical protein SAMN05216238_11213 [Lentibacillus persicus]
MNKLVIMNGQVMTPRGVWTCPYFLMLTENMSAFIIMVKSLQNL